MASKLNIANAVAKKLSSLFMPVLLLLSTLLYGATQEDPLGAFFDGLNTLQADFQQQVVNESGMILRQATGTVWIQRPGKFRWDYKTPYHQLVLADGDRLWNYDEDLEQATVKDVDAVLSSTPAMLLSGSEPITDVFLVTNTGKQNGFQWVELEPKSKATSFERIRLGFAHKTLVRMEMRDLFGQVTRFEFSNMQRNHPLSPDLFIFSPPAGVDVFGMP
ncbi:MAG: outer membrane lipoprotein chaperone LolA [Gammaproteobacteria bacterium]